MLGPEPPLVPEVRLQSPVIPQGQARPDFLKFREGPVVLRYP
jgi:hypothetical protein